MISHPSSAPPIDYEKLFDRRIVTGYYGVEPEPAGTYYDDDRGMFVTTAVDGGVFSQDLIRFAPDALAFTGLGTPRPVPHAAHHWQVIGPDDWLHFSLRLGGGATEDISGFRLVDQPSHVCTVTRYPAHTEIERTSNTDAGWKVACLWLKPSALLRFLEISPCAIPPELAWLVDGRSKAVEHVSVRLNPKTHSIVDEVLQCRLKGGVRRAFIFARYLDLLIDIYQNVIEDNAPRRACLQREDEKIHRVAGILRGNTEAMEPLDVLARRVGISRTKLVTGFRGLYHTSVEAYWRGCRMQQASDLLRDEGLSVTEVAYRVGFSEVSSFTRAFTRQFGILPRSCRLPRRPPEIRAN